MTHSKINEILEKLKQDFQELYTDRLINLILFGSQARADAEIDSDIDILVMLSGEVDVKFHII